MKILFNETPAIKEAESLYPNFNSNEEYRILYEAAEKKERDRLMIERVLMDRGHAEGRKENQIDVAKRAKLMGLPLENIEKLSGLSRQEIEDI